MVKVKVGLQHSLRKIGGDVEDNHLTRSSVHCTLTPVLLSLIAATLALHLQRGRSPAHPQTSTYQHSDRQLLQNCLYLRCHLVNYILALKQYETQWNPSFSLLYFLKHFTESRVKYCSHCIYLTQHHLSANALILFYTNPIVKFCIYDQNASWPLLFQLGGNQYNMLY